MSRSLRDSTKPAASCVACFAWGVLPGKRCRACFSFKTNYAEGDCVGCRLTVPVKKGYCRLCWHQAGMESRGITRTAEPYLEKIRFQQLFLADLQYPRQSDVRPGKAGRRALQIKPAPEPVPRPSVWIQPPLFGQPPRDFAGFNRFRHSDPANAHLVHARRQLTLTAEARGWSEEMVDDVDRALAVVLSGHAETDTVRYSELIPALRQRGLRIGRAAEILEAAGLLTDDRIPAFDTWMQRKLADVAPCIAADVQAWLRVLHDGGPRSRARSAGTVWHYLNEILPILIDWTTCFDHLREVTVDDVHSAVAGLHGHKRHITCVVLRSLFGHCKQNGTIFRNPAARLKTGRLEYGVILPLDPGEIGTAIAAAAHPAQRLAVALAAVHAAGPKAICDLQLDAVDLGNRRLTIAGHTRPIDDLTYGLLVEWLDYRRKQWPRTGNPHLLINRVTALGTGPGSRLWLTKSFVGTGVGLERLRVDRQLDEALTAGPDPLHLAEMFGIGDVTAIRYAHAARALLESPIETATATTIGTHRSTTAKHTDRPSGSA